MDETQERIRQIDALLRFRAEQRYQALLEEHGLNKPGLDSFEDKSRRILLRLQAENEVGLRSGE